MEAAKSQKLSPLFAAIIGFLAGCAVMYPIWPRGAATHAKTPTPDSLAASNQSQRQSVRTQTETTGKLSTVGATPTQPVLRSINARRVLGEIKRNKSADVRIRLFDTRAVDGKIFPSREFINLFQLSSDEVSKLMDLLQNTKTKMWNAARAQVQVSHTETGGIVLKIPPLDAGPDIYDKATSGLQTILGDDRFNDMMLFNDNQLERLFNQFGGEERTITIERSSDGRYDVITRSMTPTGQGREVQTMSMDEIKKYRPEYLDFIPTK